MYKKISEEKFLSETDYSNSEIQNDKIEHVTLKEELITDNR